MRSQTSHRKLDRVSTEETVIDNWNEADERFSVFIAPGNQEVRDTLRGSPMNAYKGWAGHLSIPMEHRLTFELTSIYCPLTE